MKLQAMDSEEMLERNLKNINKTSQELRIKIQTLNPNIPIQERNALAQRFEALRKKALQAEAEFCNPHRKK